jgi:hypothetical protein
LDLMKKKLEKSPTLTTSQLKMRIPELERISVRTIQRNCKIEWMRIQRLEFRQGLWALG